MKKVFASVLIAGLFAIGCGEEPKKPPVGGGSKPQTVSPVVPKADMPPTAKPDEPKKADTPPTTKPDEPKKADDKKNGK